MGTELCISPLPWGSASLQFLNFPAIRQSQKQRFGLGIGVAVEKAPSLLQGPDPVSTAAFPEPFACSVRCWERCWGCSPCWQGHHVPHDASSPSLAQLLGA